MSLFFTLTPKYADTCVTLWHAFANYTAAQICHLKSQRLTNGRVFFLVIAASATSMPRTVTFGFSESSPRLVLRSHSCCMWWADRCHLHDLGYPFDYLRNLYTIFWQVVSLCRRQQILINSSCVKFHKNSSRTSVVYSDRRTDGEDLSVFLILYVVSLSEINQMKK
jgi:hypothetical protein